MLRHAIPECTECGLCCVAPTDQEGFADVTSEDERRLGERFVKLHVFYPRLIDCFCEGRMYGIIRSKFRPQKTGPLKGFECNCCVALRGSLMRQVSCRVYDRRPQVCRDAVKPGDRTCLGLRKKFANMLTSEGFKKLK